jgi:hypothetical protein
VKVNGTFGSSLIPNMYVSCTSQLRASHWPAS